MLPSTPSWLIPSVLAGTSLTLALLSGEASAQTFTEEHVALVIDRSGSMQLTRVSGLTRFTEAITRANEFVRMPTALPRQFAVWTFEGGEYIKEQPFSNATTTLATLNRLAPGNGTTPLAYAICDAADEVLQFAPGIPARKVVHLISDGEENSTPEDTLCFGPSSATRYPDLQEGSWQWKIRNMLKTGDPLRDSPNPYKLIVDVDIFYNHLTLDAGASLSEHPFLTFLQGIAVASGGTYTPIEDTLPAPILGDINKDHCVDGWDYNYLVGYYNMAVPPAGPAADLNNDRRVDVLDYNILLGNLGKGCPKPVTPMSPAPSRRMAAEE